MKKNARIIFSLLDTPAFGGAEQYMFSHLYFLMEQGYMIVLATNNPKVKDEILSRLTPSEKKDFLIIAAPYRLDAIGNWKGLVKFFLSLPRAMFWCYRTLHLLTKHYEKVICLWPGFSDRLVFSPIAHHFHCPLVWIEIGPLEPTFKHTWGFPRMLFHFSEKYPDHIATTSLFTKKSIIRNSRFTNKQITLVYPGTKLFTDNEILAYREQAKQWKQKEKLERIEVIGVVARLAHENEVDMVIRAIDLCIQKKENKKILLLIIGDGPVKKELENMVADLSLENNIRFTGFVTEEEKRILLSACSFFIFPRAWELDGFGMTTIEAMSLGLPVLTTNFGPQIEIVTDGKEGYRYRPHDSRDLAEKILKMIRVGKTRRNRMGHAAVKRVSYFSDVNSHKAMLAIIKRVAS